MWPILQLYYLLLHRPHLECIYFRLDKRTSVRVHVFVRTICLQEIINFDMYSEIYIAREWHCRKFVVLIKIVIKCVPSSPQVVRQSKLPLGY